MEIKEQQNINTNKKLNLTRGKRHNEIAYNMENAIFECKSSMDKRTKIKTVFVFLVFALLTSFLFLKSDNHIGLLFFAIFLSLTYIIACIFGIYKTPISYKILNGDLIIKSRFTRKAISIREIRNLRIFDSEDRKGLIRIFGVEGVLGNIGYYSSTRNNKMTILTSRDTNWILIDTKDNEKIVISPDDLALVNLVNKLIKNNEN
ncbi:PH domain-containing protein [uncultured Draconibacterium sp.]|uniref:PH domain-containing protein n=1 Tax=uncultured Draconibacterium sp. TaxID=1573823 RepID=UPI0029C85ACD|nr:PH domain-containing protein [uncultured Draconibacterium sp.]